jgi:hypothetical protein
MFCAKILPLFFDGRKHFSATAKDIECHVEACNWMLSVQISDIFRSVTAEIDYMVRIT